MFAYLHPNVTFSSSLITLTPAILGSDQYSHMESYIAQYVCQMFTVKIFSRIIAID